MTKLTKTGAIKFSKYCYENEPEIVKQALKDMIPLSVEWKYDTVIVHVHCDEFEENKYELCYPNYSVVISNGKRIINKE